MRSNQNFCHIIQSSGTGKSRMIDQLSTTHLVLPICLRMPGLSKLPPPDHRVRDFLGHGLTPRYTEAFFIALFQVALQALQELRKQAELHDYARLAGEFRLRMTEGQTLRNSNEYRRVFYDKVIEITEKNYSDLSRVGTESKPVITSGCALTALSQFLRQLVLDKLSPSERAIEGNITKDWPLIVISFDDASSLTKIEACKTTVFGLLSRKIQSLNYAPVYALFISTSWPFSPRELPDHKPDHSSHILRRVIAPVIPYTVVSFDEFALKREDGSVRTCNSILTISEISGEWFMSHLGRALWPSRIGHTTRNDLDSVKNSIVSFAAGELLNDSKFNNLEKYSFSNTQKFACLGQRFSLEFDPKQAASCERQKAQVERHLRIYLQVDPTFESLVTVSSSEPLLSEAAFAVMQNSGFIAADALYHLFKRHSVRTGDREELLVFLLLTQARDAAVCAQNDQAMWKYMQAPAEGWNRVISVSTFIENLFEGLPDSIVEGIRQDFAGMKLHFNQIKKVHEQAVMQRFYLAPMFARGIGIFCADRQLEESVDVVLPFLIGEHVCESSIGSILINTRGSSLNDGNPNWDVFDEMDPFVLGTLDFDDDNCPLPVIRVVFALAEKPALHAKREEIEYDENKSFVAYNIWCAGLSSDLLKPITKAQERRWSSLLDIVSHSWQGPFKANGRKRMHSRSQTMAPGVASDSMFWKNFFPLPDGESSESGGDESCDSAEEHDSDKDSVDEELANMTKEQQAQLIAQLDNL
ncbi:hypothetical protein DFH11DRAFT_364549 [Phellopilus nigrolimitatus]|nr:hypothetical protein DFH11DRAFT_364549 [Phellopilus nigrolimitatus]